MRTGSATTNALLVTRPCNGNWLKHREVEPLSQLLFPRLSVVLRWLMSLSGTASQENSPIVGMLFRTNSYPEIRGIVRPGDLQPDATC
jgi:hypothetical protein